MPLSDKFVVFYFLVDSLGGKVSLFLLSFGHIPLSGEFVVSYPLVDSLGSEVSPYSSITSTILSSYP